MAASTNWLPSEGNWSVLVRAFDVYDASSAAEEALCVGPIVLNHAKSSPLLSIAKGSAAVGDSDGALGVTTSLTSTLNRLDTTSEAGATSFEAPAEAAATNSSTSSASNSSSAAQAARAAQVELRTGIIALIVEVSPGAVSDAGGGLQLVTAVDSVLGGECSDTALDMGAEVLGSMVGAAQEVGLADGAAEKAAAVVGSMLSRGAAASSSLPEGSRRRLAAEVKRKERDAQLINSTHSLSDAIGNALVEGEAPMTVQSPSLTMSVNKQPNPCAKNAATGATQAATTELAAPTLDSGIGGTFSLPTAALCSGEGAERRRLLQDQSACQDRGVQSGVTLFGSNAYAAPSNGTVGTVSQRPQTMITHLVSLTLDKTLEPRVRDRLSPTCGCGSAATRCR